MNLYTYICCFHTRYYDVVTLNKLIFSTALDILQLAVMHLVDIFSFIKMAQSV